MIVRRSIRTIWSTNGISKIRPGPFCAIRRPSRKITPRSYSRRIRIDGARMISDEDREDCDDGDGDCHVSGSFSRAQRRARTAAERGASDPSTDSTRTLAPRLRPARRRRRPRPRPAARATAPPRRRPGRPASSGTRTSPAAPISSSAPGLHRRAACRDRLRHRERETGRRAARRRRSRPEPRPRTRSSPCRTGAGPTTASAITPTTPRIPWVGRCASAIEQRRSRSPAAAIPAAVIGQLGRAVRRRAAARRRPPSPGGSARG